ncbi:MAG: tetratricopeptide repeat protein [Bradymonadia bacterium]
MKSLLAQKHFERGRQFELQSRDEAAIQCYRQACHIGPDTPEPFVALGRLEAMHGRLDHALKALDEGLKFGFDPEATEWRAYVRGRLRHFRAALSDYESLIAEGLDNAEVYINAARMLIALGRYDEAEVRLREVDGTEVLLDALPRYREYPGQLAPDDLGDSNDDLRAIRYLFGSTVILGTLGDGGQPLAHSRYMLLTPRHVAVTVGRLTRLIGLRRWQFDCVAGSGPHHGPLAETLAQLLELPVEPRPVPGTRVLMVSAVVNGTDESVALEMPWRDRGAKLLHFALGFVPDGDPSPREPALVGLVGRGAVPWFRTAPYARLVPDEDLDGSAESPWPGFKVGPAFIDPNGPRVTQTLVEACLSGGADPFMSTVLDYYIARHPQGRAFRWSEE